MAAATHPLRQHGLLLAALLAAALGPSGAGCSDEQPITLAPTCPNRVPIEGAACGSQLSCTYFDASGCVETFTAICINGVWVFEGRCAAGGAGGTGAGSSGGSGGSGGEAGTGGSVCVDPVAGPPTVISPTAATYPPDTVMGRYRLQLSEAATGVSSHLSWTGSGLIEDVDKVGSKLWDITFSGLPPGDSAVLTSVRVTERRDEQRQAGQRRETRHHIVEDAPRVGASGHAGPARRGHQGRSLDVLHRRSCDTTRVDPPATQPGSTQPGATRLDAAGAACP